MIPSVEERMKLPCFDCGWNEDNTRFYVDQCEFLHMGSTEEYYCTVRDDIEFNMSADRPKDDLCKYRFTTDEIKELIESVEK